ncbi:MAG: hypothetical protein AAF669_05590 [Pseudomonadota bacterium]
MEKQRHLHIHLGESFADFVHRNPVEREYKKPSGSNIMFYKYRWRLNPPASPASVTFHYGHNDIIVHNLIYMRVLEDRRDDSGIGDIYLQAGITPDGWMPHTEARIQFHAFLQYLLAKGWRYAQGYEAPRLSGAQAMRYKLNEEPYFYLDPAYLPTRQEWRALRQGSSATNYWNLHIDNKAFMRIQVGFEDHKTDLELGSYILFIYLLNGEQQARRYFSPDDEHRMNKRNWQIHWEERLQMARKTRAEREKTAIMEGYKIDESYQDYAINPADY